VTPTVFVYEGPDMLKLQMEKRDNGDTVAEYTMGARAALEAQRRRQRQQRLPLSTARPRQSRASARRWR